jgi:hypothetical protein
VCKRPIESESGRKRLHGDQKKVGSCANEWMKRKLKANYDRYMEKLKKEPSKRRKLINQGYDNPDNGDDSWLNF